MLRWFAALSLLFGLVLPQIARAQAASGSFSHIYIIMEENSSYEDLIGNTADAPYINYLANTYGFAANYYGVTHPSMPNYIAATAGQFFSHSDNPSQVFDATNIVDQLDAAGKTWAAYMQSMPSVGFTGQGYPAGGAALYVNKHNPFVLYKDILDSPERLSNDKPASMLASDLASGTAPNYVWISPDVCHDMHGMPSSDAIADGEPWCAYPPNFVLSHPLIQQADSYLKTLVTTIMSSPAWTSDSAIAVTWDENESSGATNANLGYASGTGCCSSPPGLGGGRVPAIVITSSPNHAVSLHPYNHYSLLRTVEDNLGLPCLANTCNADVHPMTDLFPPAGSSVPLSQLGGVAVTFSSTNPGQGMVLFGSGPGCEGLIETATRDVSAGTTQHTVLVQGDDFAPQGMDIGLTPGATYWYEAITSTPEGEEVDNNNGKCYTFTMTTP